MAFEKRGQDQSDQLLIGEALESRNETEIGMTRVEPCERIDFQKLRPAIAVAANIDAAAVAAAQRPPG